jgi:hypothetical protein
MNKPINTTLIALLSLSSCTANTGSNQQQVLDMPETTQLTYEHNITIGNYEFPYSACDPLHNAAALLKRNYETRIVDGNEITITSYDTTKIDDNLIEALRQADTNNDKKVSREEAYLYEAKLLEKAIKR